MQKEIMIINSEQIREKIYTIRGLQVMLGKDLSNLYGVQTKRLNEQVKRNIDRFPESFMFQLTKAENNSLRSQFATLETGKHSKYLPYVFTEAGVAMLSAILKSDVAIAMSVQIIEAFVNMRKLLSNNAMLFQRFDKMEKKQSITDMKVEELFQAIEAKNIHPDQGIFCDGQVFDAYVFVATLIKNAKSSIILIDNYIDETILTLLSKRNKDCKAFIYTRSVSKKLQLDLDKYNAQYSHIDIKTIANVHDRFLVLDKKEIYHIGASLKDLGKKLFAFSKLNVDVAMILDKLE